MNTLEECYVATTIINECDVLINGEKVHAYDVECNVKITDVTWDYDDFYNTHYIDRFSWDEVESVTMLRLPNTEKSVYTDDLGIVELVEESVNWDDQQIEEVNW